MNQNSVWQAPYTMGPASGALPSNPPTLSSLASWAGLLGSVPVIPGCTPSGSIALGYPTSSPVSLEDGDWLWICFSLTFYELDSLLTRVHSEPLYEILCHLTINFETSLSGLFLFLFSVVWTWVHIWLLCDPHGFPPGLPLKPLLLIFVLLVFLFFLRLCYATHSSILTWRSPWSS